MTAEAIADRLHEAHRTFLCLVGQERLDACVNQWRHLFYARRKIQGASVLETGMEFLKSLQERNPNNAGEQLQLLAVTVELMRMWEDE